MRIVITGGPSVGKTTLVSLLQASGFPVVHEQATQIIKEGQILPWLDRAAFQSEVLSRQLAAETALAGESGTVFLDRGLFDGEAYYIYDQLEIPPAFAAFNAQRYDLALLVEELPFFEANEIRRENIQFSRQISKILENCYASRGVPVVRIPALPPAERLDYLLKVVDRAAGRFSARISIVESWTELQPALV